MTRILPIICIVLFFTLRSRAAVPDGDSAGTGGPRAAARTSDSETTGAFQGDRATVDPAGDNIRTGRPRTAAVIRHPEDNVSSTMQEAIRYLESVKIPDSSAWWPHVKGYLFIENLKVNILTPLAMYQGSNTNFCGYAAASYLPLHNDPLTYVRFMVALYQNGSAEWGKVHFTPSPEVRKGAGTLRFKGVLDIRPADQMWFLSLADHFRSYLNFFNRKFKPGAEDTFWAAVNLGKFNRILRTLLGYEVHAVGSDLIRPSIKDFYQYLTHAVQTGTTFLYVNNTYLHKKSHDKSRFSFPTHFIVLSDIELKDDVLTIVYWDYGGRTLRQVTPAFLKKITFGVTYVTKQPNAE